MKELYRVLMPGRCVSIHCMNLPTSKERNGIGIELKKSYYDQAVINCRQAESAMSQPSLFDFITG